jgi:hypothetical protein
MTAGLQKYSTSATVRLRLACMAADCRVAAPPARRETAGNGQ